MMNTMLEPVKPHDLLVNELEYRYKSEGYDVLVSPNKAELPPFLQPFHPDLIATRPDSSLVVEVWSKGKVRRSDYWGELQAAAGANGWRLELFVNAPSEERESLSATEVESLLGQARFIANGGALQAAIVLLWSAFEASARLALEKYNYPVSDPASPVPLIVTLFTNGLLDRDAYDALRRYSGKRNRIVHGYRDSVAQDDVTHLAQIVRDLLQE